MLIKSFVYSLTISLFLSLSVYGDGMDDCLKVHHTPPIPLEDVHKFCMPPAEQGNVIAQQFIADNFYVRSIFVKNNYEEAEKYIKEAVKWYRLAAEQGNARAQYKLGDMYEKGEGVIVNYTKAAEFYSLSARQGHLYGMYNLAQMYSEGKGVEEDKIYAYMWFNLSDEARHSLAKEKREELSEKMTTKELRIAQELSQKCLDSDYKKCESALPNFLHRKFNLSSEDKD